MGHPARPHNAKAANHRQGLSLVEMMVAGGAYVPTVFVGMYATMNRAGAEHRLRRRSPGSSFLLGRLVMGIPCISPPTHRDSTQSANHAEGFSLLEMMMVVTLILIIASITTPIYMTAMVRAREAVLRDHLYTLRALIDRFTLDNGRAPARLEELVEKGYLGRLPTDPFTGSNPSADGQEDKEDAPLSPDANPSVDGLGIVDVHSGSSALSLEGSPYNTW
jgi:general secretion pathway protein G